MIERIIAHRGASAYAPENTIAAFDKAAILGARMIEFDVMLSQDGEPFVVHDENLKRTTNGRGEVGKVDAAYIKTLDAGKWFSKKFSVKKVPPLQEVLKWLIFSDMKANIEIKPYPGTMEATTVAVMTMINRFWPQTKPFTIGFQF